MIRDGFLVIHVTKPNISATTVCLAPKPPPILGFSTLIFDFGIPSALAKIRRTWKTILRQLITCKRP